MSLLPPLPKPLAALAALAVGALPAAAFADPPMQSAGALAFDRLIDRLSLASGLWVETRDGAPVAGAASVLPGEAAWRFAPDEPWHAGPYALRIGGRLEDVAGNTLDFAFDRAIAAVPPEPGASPMLPISVQ